MRQKKHLSFTLLCFFGGEIIDKKKYSGTDLHLWATVHILLPCYYCRCGGHSVPALRQLRSSCSMKQHHVDCGCLSVLGSHKQAAGYCFQMSCNTSPPPKAVPCLLFFLLLCFSQYSVTCFSESGVRLVCDTCLFMAAVQRKTSGVTSLFLFLSFFLLLQSLSKCFFFFFACSFTFSYCPVSPIPADPNRTNYFECSCRKYRAGDVSSLQEIAPTSQTKWPFPHPFSDNEIEIPAGGKQ